jgi:UDP-4-amino-4,6-dideoxy-N-acetyl-beta-L-altrosamine transaminase
VLPYGRQSIDASDVEAVVAALGTDWLTTGPAVDRFEADLAGVTGGHGCVAVTSGTAALHVAYAALGVGPGDEVVTTPMTFVATASCASMLGAQVVFVDVEEDTANIDPAAVQAAVTGRTKVIAAVDYAGHAAEYDALQEVAQGAGAALLADAAHSVGGSYRGRPVGSLTDCTTLSFFPTKNLTTAEGGAVVCRDPDVERRAREFRTIGLVRDRGRQRHPDEGAWHQEVHAFGLNYRIPDLLCALGSNQLRRLPGFVARRAELVARYARLLADVPGLRLPVQRSHVEPAWHLFPVRVLEGRRREVFDALRAAGIGVQVNYIPAYWHPVYEDLGYRRGMCPRAEQFYAEELSLPLFPSLTDAQQDRVVEALTAVLC